MSTTCTCLFNSIQCRSFHQDRSPTPRTDLWHSLGSFCKCILSCIHFISVCAPALHANTTNCSQLWSLQYILHQFFSFISHQTPCSILMSSFSTPSALTFTLTYAINRLTPQVKKRVAPIPRHNFGKTDYKNSFTAGLSRKFTAKLLLYFLPHLKRVATLPCKIQKKSKIPKIRHI